MIPIAADAPVWAHDFARRVETEIDAQIIQPAYLPDYLKSDLPDAGRYRYRMIFVRDDTDGAVPAFSDGAAWRRCTDRAVVS
ncbi:MAG: hypothetical protein RIF37_00580 [Rhodospirillaceae bacterium]